LVLVCDIARGAAIVFNPFLAWELGFPISSQVLKHKFVLLSCMMIRHLSTMYRDMKDDMHTYIKRGTLAWAADCVFQIIDAELPR